MGLKTSEMRWFPQVRASDEVPTEVAPMRRAGMCGFFKLLTSYCLPQMFNA